MKKKGREKQNGAFFLDNYIYVSLNSMPLSRGAVRRRLFFFPFLFFSSSPLFSFLSTMS